jgi:hypothetical protein
MVAAVRSVVFTHRILVIRTAPHDREVRIGRKEEKEALCTGLCAKCEMASFASTAGVGIAPHTLSLICPDERRDESEGYGVCNEMVWGASFSVVQLPLYTQSGSLSNDGGTCASSFVSSECGPPGMGGALSVLGVIACALAEPS